MRVDLDPPVNVTLPIDMVSICLGDLWDKVIISIKGPSLYPEIEGYKCFVTTEAAAGHGITWVKEFLGLTDEQIEVIDARTR